MKAQYSQIETERLLAELVKIELDRRRNVEQQSIDTKFSAVCFYLGYQACRCVLMVHMHLGYDYFQLSGVDPTPASAISTKCFALGAFFDIVARTSSSARWLAAGVTYYCSARCVLRQYSLLTTPALVTLVLLTTVITTALICYWQYSLLAASGVEANVPLQALLYSRSASVD